MNALTTVSPTDMTGASIDIRPAAAYLASLAPVGRRGITSALNRVAATLGARDWQGVNWATLNAANMGAIMARIEGAPTTINHTRAALRGVARSAWRLGILSTEERARIDDIKPARGSRELTGRDIEPWEIAALMRTCADDKTAAGRRDAALIALAAKTGMRREELAEMHTDRLTVTPDGFDVKIIGKGNKERAAYVDEGAAQALRDWLALRGDAPGFLFVAINKGGKIVGEGISTTALNKMLAKRCAAAKVNPLTWHDFRRTFAGALLTLGEDISTVAQLMGHSSVSTTARYDRRPAEMRRKAARRVSVPYFGA